MLTLALICILIQVLESYQHCYKRQGKKKEGVETEVADDFVKCNDAIEMVIYSQIY